MKRGVLIGLLLILLVIKFSIGQHRQDKSVGSTQSTQYLAEHFAPIDIPLGTFVTCGIQDSQGFLWFGTMDGLYRYDGYEFMKIDVGQEPGQRVQSLMEDKAGNIWGATEQKGLFKYVPVVRICTGRTRLMQDTLPIFFRMKMRRFG